MNEWAGDGGWWEGGGGKKNEKNEEGWWLRDDPKELPPFLDLFAGLNNPRTRGPHFRSPSCFQSQSPTSSEALFFSLPFPVFGETL